jgi:hypothetical protein
MIFIPHYLHAKRSMNKHNSFSRSVTQNLRHAIMSCTITSKSEYRVDSAPGKTEKSNSRSRWDS